MAGLFGVDLPKILNGALGSNSLDATLVVVTPGTRTPGDPTSGTNPTTANKTAKGYVQDYDDFQVDGEMVQRGDRKIVLFADAIESSAVPKTSDRITIESSTYDIVNVKRGPAAATYVCQARGKR